MPVCRKAPVVNFSQVVRTLHVERSLCCHGDAANQMERVRGVRSLRGVLRGVFFSVTRHFKYRKGDYGSACASVFLFIFLFNSTGVSMKYDTDRDLAFLETSTSDNLHPLVSLLLYDTQGQTRKGAKLHTLSVYRQHAPNHRAYWPEIIEQIAIHGAGTFLERIVGKRTEYSKILNHVVKKAKISVMSDLSADIVEEKIFTTIFLETIPSLSLGELQAVSPLFGINQVIPDTHTFATALQNAAAGNESLTALTSLIVAHGAAMYACGVGYSASAPRVVRDVLEIFEQPLRRKFLAMPLNALSRDLLLPMVMQIAFLRRVDQMDLVSLLGLVHIPDQAHPRWREIILGQKVFKLKYFAVKMLLGRIVCRIAADPSEEMVREGIAQLHAIYAKNVSSPAAQEDLKTIFELE